MPPDWPAHILDSHMTLDTIRNFVAVSNDLVTSGQPTEEQLAAVRSQGFEVVVNLGLLDPKYCLADEAGTVAGLGMAYHHVPVDIQRPTLENFDAFRLVMQQERGRRVFVHCAANIRVSCFVALLGETDLGWSREQADAHIARLWRPNPVWAGFLNEVRATRVRFT